MRTERRRCGFTMVEIMIAAGMLSLLFLGVFSLYTNTAGSFSDGEWRISTQKSAQLMLNALREDFEKANSPFRVLADGTIGTITNTPIYITNEALNDSPAGTNVASSNASVSVKKALAFCAISAPFVDASTFVPVASPGLWLGCSLGLVGRDLVYRRTGDPTVHSSDPVALPGSVMTFPTGGVGPGKMFLSDSRGETRLTVKDVESVAFYRSVSAQEQTLEIRITMARRKGSQVRGTFSERTLAKLLPVSTISGF